MQDESYYPLGHLDSTEVGVQATLNGQDILIQHSALGLCWAYATSPGPSREPAQRPATLALSHPDRIAPYRMIHARSERRSTLTAHPYSQVRGSRSTLIQVTPGDKLSPFSGTGRSMPKSLVSVLSTTTLTHRLLDTPIERMCLFGQCTARITTACTTS
jgi:hypothetical protein